MKSLILCALLLFGVCGLQASDEPSDLERMQGRWEIVALVEKGKEAPKTEIETLVVVIDKDTFTTYEKDQAVVKYRIKLDSAKAPKAIDFTHLMGDNKDKTEPGIYVIDNDLFKLVLNEDRKERPTVFEGKETASYSVLVLKKKKDVK